MKPKTKKEVKITRAGLIKRINFLLRERVGEIKYPAAEDEVKQLAIAGEMFGLLTRYEKSVYYLRVFEKARHGYRIQTRKQFLDSLKKTIDAVAKSMGKK